MKQFACREVAMKDLRERFAARISVRAMIISLWLVLIIPFLAWADGTGEPPLAHFKKGKIQFKSGGKSYSIPLGSAELYKGFINAQYSMETENPGGAPTQRSFRFTLIKIGGPGKYGNESISAMDLTMNEGFAFQDIKDEKQIQDMMMEALQEKKAVFDNKRSNCTVEIQRFSTSGIEGAMACRRLTDGEGGEGLQLSDILFSAAP